MLALGSAEADVIAVGDEYALFDLRSGLVDDWLRPCAFGRATEASSSGRCPPSDNRAVPVGVVAAIRYEPDGPPTAPIGRTDTVIPMLENCVCGASRPADAFDAAVRITAAAVAVDGCHADAAGGLNQVLEVLGDW